MKDAHRIVQTFRLVNFVSGRVEQVSRAHHEGSLRISYALRQLIQIRLANRSLAKVFPRSGIQTFANSSIHKLISHNTKHFDVDSFSTLSTKSPAFKLTLTHLKYADKQGYPWTKLWWIAIQDVIESTLHPVRRRVNCPNIVQTHLWRKVSLPRLQTSARLIGPKFRCLDRRCNWFHLNSCPLGRMGIPRITTSRTFRDGVSRGSFDPYFR